MFQHKRTASQNRLISCSILNSFLPITVVNKTKNKKAQKTCKKTQKKNKNVKKLTKKIIKLQKNPKKRKVDVGGRGWTWVDMGGRGLTLVDVDGLGWMWVDAGLPILLTPSSSQIFYKRRTD